MTLQLSLDESQSRQIAAAAQRLGIDPEEIIRRSIDSYLAKQEKFDAAATHVLAKNAELYRRLA
ncbi:MAG: hypothetical protein K1X57_17165 [Gemmataceae bacterium]|nr:hypothetical protein [Gemmataceae bacterium]